MTSSSCSGDVGVARSWPPATIPGQGRRSRPEGVVRPSAPTARSGGRIAGVTEPGRPALSLDRLEAVVFDTDGVLTDTASVHAAAWKRLFDEYLRLRATRDGEPFRPFTEADYLRSVDGRAAPPGDPFRPFPGPASLPSVAGRPRYDGVAGFLASRGIELPWGDPDDPPDRETVGGLGHATDRYVIAH